MVQRFASSPQRIGILRGLLAYRRALAQQGITTGFQWLDGSFMENKEAFLDEPPADVDVVTFFLLPAGVENQSAFAAMNADVFDPARTKAVYQVHAYALVLGEPMGALDIRLISYWYSMWSHRRDGLWKGFLQVDISPEQDHIAEALLNQIEQERLNP